MTQVVIAHSHLGYMAWQVVWPKLYLLPYR
jgi:hypothetical protein